VEFSSRTLDFCCLFHLEGLDVVDLNDFRHQSSIEFFWGYFVIISKKFINRFVIEKPIPEHSQQLFIGTIVIILFVLRFASFYM